MENKTDYERKDGISGTYIVFGTDYSVDESVEAKMLQNNDISGILSCDFRYEDNKLYIYYDITDKMSISEIIKGQELTYEILRGIYETFIKTIKNCEKYLISADSILFRKDLIFGNKNCNELKFCILPGGNSSFRKQMKDLTEEFMKIADHGERKCVEFIYGIYDIVSENDFHINDIETFLAGIEYTNLHIEEGGNGDSTLSNKSESFITENPEQNKSEMYVQNKEEYFSLVRKNIKNILLREFVPEIINVKKSVSFSCGMEDMIHVGRSNENEVIFPQNYISRKHAVLEADENYIYITDKGSLNGTFVNGEKISANVKTRCRVKDEITFADISFIVV